MPGRDDRVVRLEERTDAHRRTMDDLQSEMRAFRAEVREEFGALRGEMRQDIAGLRSDLKQDIAELRSSSDRRFTWLIGIQIAGLIAVIGALVGSYFR